MLSIFIDIPDSFYERMGFTNYKNKYGGFVGDADDLVMYGPQVSSTMASSISLVTILKLSTICGVYIIEKNSEYYMAKRGDTNEF